jgi:CO dehydrogenase/acetyl-CoA synthase gamma subunit (corrinoid Fe-S protein)
MRFIRFAVKWVGNNLAVPFWVVGHVHLSVNVYEDVIEIVSSVGMNVVVLIALWLDWKDSNNT